LPNRSLTMRKTMNVSLTPELERFVAGRVASGRYRSASEVVRAALRCLDKEDRRHPSEFQPRQPTTGGGDDGE
jgi:antitoxin ParD1/3/4